MPVDPLSYFQGTEVEVLLGHGAELKVISATKDANGILRVVVEIVGGI